ncbi:MAG: ABC transporter ATP-binding protein [Actinomycetota bacterium]|nr:ABC transporter ATP-binding protein [Actinomycetota bacterium]
MNGRHALEIRSLSKRFGSTAALHPLDLDVNAGEFLTLLGPSGSGKTTLLRLIVGFESPTEGRIVLDGRDISGLSPADRSAGMVFQNYALFPHMTVRENVEYGLKIRRASREERRRRVLEMLELVQLTGFDDRYPRQLSGGQQQRVALARALAYKPTIILMDEPLGALDRTLRIEMEHVIRTIHRSLEATVIYVTHDRQEALALSDRIAIMRAGRIVTIGKPEDHYYRPADSFVASFFSDANLLPVVKYVSTAGGDTARVTAQGDVFDCPSSHNVDGEARLAVRPRSLGLKPVGGIGLRGLLLETLLYGDERELICEVPGVGRVTALVPSRASADLAVGQAIELHAAHEDLVLVRHRDDDDAPAPSAADRTEEP